MKIRSVFLCLLVLVACLAMTAAFCPAEDTKPDTKCVEPAKGPLTTAAPVSQEKAQEQAAHRHVTARVGKPAPDFEANAFVNGGFKTIKLSSYKGKWVVLCFYPGDFTFV